jgi:anti-sigma regulatory factor (Ser/Thr protein kinase)
VLSTAAFCLPTHNRLPASSDAPRLARQLIGLVPPLANYPDLRFAAQLLTSELVANSVRHAGLSVDQDLALTVECDDEMLRVEVIDAAGGFDALRLLAEHHRRRQRHRGVFLVDALADRWGFRRGEGSLVWFEIELVPGRRPWRGRQRVPERQPSRQSCDK